MTGVRFVGVVGQICTLQDGNAFEKAGVSVSVTHGRLTDKRIEYFAPYHPNLKNVVSHKPAEEFPFSVASISLVMHPHNPMVRKWEFACFSFVNHVASAGLRHMCRATTTPAPSALPSEL